ncbi:hypothetical protein [Paracoccus sp. (in: a-proteobacteria)]|uniref:hypothetical protein n=1 Tax=Paracoccus sp. TaxID=267 RepID=UPI0035ADF066
MSTDQEDELAFDTATTTEIPPGRIPVWMIVVLVLFGGIFTAIGVMMLREQVGASSAFVFLMGVLMLGLGIFALIKQRRSALGGATLAPEGLALPGTEGKLIPWSEVSGLQIAQTRHMTFVGVGLTETGRGYLNRSKLMHRTAKATEASFGPGDVTITQQLVGIPLGMFYALVLAYASAHAGHPWADAQLSEIAEIGNETAA